MRRVLSFRMTFAEWIGLGLIVNVPYVVIGIIWSVANAGRFDDLHGFGRMLALLGGVLAWPVLLLPGVCVS